MTANTFAALAAFASVVSLIGGWTLHADDERGARTVCFVLGVIAAVSAMGAWVGAHWYG